MGNGCIFTRCDPGARVVLMRLVVVMLSMCSPVEFIVYDSRWSSFAVLCLVHFVGSLVWPHRFRHRILHFKYVHPMRQIAEIQKLSAATGAFGYKHSNVLSGLQHSRTHEYDGQPPVDEVDWTLMKAVCPTMRHVSRTHRVALDWLFDRINLDPKIQIKYIDTKNQLADILTNGNFTRDENHLLC